MKFRLSNLDKLLPWVGQAALWVIAAAVAFKVPGDPDLGWHLANGRYTIDNLAVQRGDIYSWTMPGFPWVSHEWAIEVIMSLIYSNVGLFALSLFFMALTLLAFWLAAKSDHQAHSNAVILAIVGAVMCYPIIGARPQMLTLLGIAVVLNLLFAWRRNPKIQTLYWFPIIFFVWANLHAGFAGGFLTIVVFGIAEFIRWVLVPKTQAKAAKVLNFQQLLTLAGFIILSALATLLNPYGWRLYDELWTTLTKPEVLNRIAEWLPIDFASLGSYNLIVGGLTILGLLIINRWQVDYTKLTLAIIFFFISTTAWRNLALFAIVSMPLLAEQLSLLSHHVFQDIQKTRIGTIGVVAVAILVVWWHGTLNVPMFTDPNVYAAANNYPYGAIQYMKEKKITGNLFNEYNWGGYLIWQFPEEKVFIDGRMAIWETKDVKIFDEFQSIMGNHRGTTLELLDKWDIDLVLTAPSRPVNGTLSLEIEDWILLYKDEEAMLWQRTN